MKQYCRYCGEASPIDLENTAYCQIKNKLFSKLQGSRVNTCKDFTFNKIDVFDLSKTYKPRELKNVSENNQISLSEVVE